MANTRELSQLASLLVVNDETRNIGIGTTNPTSKLHVSGDVRVSGVVTATSFSGDGSALTGLSVGVGTTASINTTGIITATTFVGALTGTATSTTNIPNLTGAITSVNTTTSLGSFSSSNLATALTDETGSGAAVFATSPTLVTPALGTPSSGTLTSCTGLPITGITSSTTIGLGVGSIELGHATDTTLARSAAGVVTIEGVNIVTTSSTDTLTNKTLTSPTLTTPVLGTPSSGTLTNCTFPTLNQNTTGNAAGLTTGRTIAITGDLTYTSPSFNGSGNVTAAGTLATVNSNVGSFGGTGTGTTITVNAKGLITGITTFAASAGGLTLTDDTSTNASRFLTFTSATSGSISAANVSSTKLTFNPSSGNLGIGTTNPGEKLQVDGNLRLGVSTTSNYLAFYGTTGDNPGSYSHTYIGERIWSTGTEKSELLLFKGNDSDTTSGPDRIRLAASQVRIDTYTTATGGAPFESVATSANLINRVVVHSTGEVGIGTDVLTGTASQRLQVTGGAYVSGNLGIGTTNPTSKLHVIGDVSVSGVITATDFNSTSDISLKDNIQTIVNPLDKIIKLNGVTFNWKENQKPSIGVIAQELQEVLPELVTQGDVKSVNYNGLIGVLIEAVKEQQKQIEELKAIVKNQ